MSFFHQVNHFFSGIKTGRLQIKDLPKRFKNYLEYKSIQDQENPYITTLYGTKLFLNKKDKVLTKFLILDHVFEPEETKFFKKIVTKGMNIIDVGANIGYYSVLFSKWVGETGKTWCFEPDPENFAFLSKNLQVNHCHNTISVRKAVSNKNEKILLFQSEENKGDHRIIDFNTSEKDVQRKKIEIDSIKLDSYIPSNEKIDIIKMDIQGSEMLALDGMMEILHSNSKMYLVTEFWPFAIEKSGFVPKEMLELLYQQGFEISTLVNGRRVPIYSNYELTNNYSSFDFVNLICEKS